MFRYLLGMFLFLLPFKVSAGEIAITFDDAPTYDSAVMTGVERTSKIISGLKSSGVNSAAFFVLGKNVDDQSAKRLLQYVDAGFDIGNHTFTHQSANKIDANEFLLDTYRAHLKLKEYDLNARYFRFPYLHYGDSHDKREGILKEIDEMNYKIGYVTIDNYDWYINSLFVKAIEDKKNVNLDNLAKLYVDIMWESIDFYDQLAIKYIGKSPRHVLLLHENDMAALFLPDLIKKIRKSGWKIISVGEAYEENILTSEGNNYEFFKQGRIAAKAHSLGAKEEELRSLYEDTESIDKLFSEYKVIE